jgi:hypothetical protein
MIKQPTKLNARENFMEMMRLRLFVNFADQWMTENKNFHFTLSVENVYYDVDSDWLYTALITYRESDEVSWQSLNGREWVELVNDDSMESIKKRAYDYMEKTAKQF